MGRIVGIWMVVAAVAIGTAHGAAQAQADGVPDRLDQHFTQARADLTAGKLRDARRHLGKAARQLEKKVHPAAGEVKQALVKNAVALKDLSAEVLRGHITDPRAIDASAGRAHAAVAKFHQARAEQRWATDEAKRSKEVGRDLRAAAHHLERGAAWLGQGADTAMTATARDARELSGRITGDAGYAAEEVDAGIQAVGREIDRLGWRVESRQGRASPGRYR